MRLLTWNCCRGSFEQKYAAIESLNYDVAVIQECARPHKIPDGMIWFGDNARQGIAILAKREYQLHSLSAEIEHRFVVPVNIQGPVSFFLLATWTHPQPTYVEPVLAASEMYAHVIASKPTVIMGDFNSNAKWNKKRRPARDHDTLVHYLSTLGLTSGQPQ